VEKRRFDRAAWSDTPVQVSLDGQHLIARPGEALSDTLLAHGLDTTSRSLKYHRPRGPFCLAGHCGRCFMRIDDLPNRPACTTIVRNGLTAERENALPSVDHDLLRAADLLFPDGLDHQRMATTPVEAVNRLIHKTTRELAGTGRVSRRPAFASASTDTQEVPVLVIGAGPAGLAALAVFQTHGIRALGLEAASEPGGHFRTGLFPELTSVLAQQTNPRLGPDSGLWTSAEAVAAYSGETGFDVLVRRNRCQTSEHLTLIHARYLLLATGGYEQPGEFPNNDRPGIYGARALARLLNERGIFPGGRMGITGSDGDTIERMQGFFGGFGIDVAPTAPDTENVLAIANRPVPAFELPGQLGCQVQLDPGTGGFRVLTGPAPGQTSISGIYAAGEVSGSDAGPTAHEDGAAAARSLLREARMKG
jgi:sarcosine oxidase, subunit alpha